MARVSLKEAYDNKDVVAQIYAIRDIAEGASDTADNAVTTANDAKTYVDTLGVQVEGAVQTANNASASAQASAQTVAGYDARLTEVEGGLGQAESDIDGLETGLGAVTVRVQTAEGQIVTIQGRVTALETAEGQNVKINDINAYAVGLTGNQPNIGGSKTFINECTGTAYYGITNKKTSFAKGDRSTNNRAWFGIMKDINDASLIRGFYDNNADGSNQIVFSSIVDVNGTATSIELLRVVTNASGTVTTIAVGGRVLS